MSVEIPPVGQKGSKETVLRQPKEPGIVTVLRFGRDPLVVPGKYFQKYGDTFKVSLFGEEMIVTRDPDWLSEVMVRKSQSFHKDKATKGLSQLLGNGLLTNDGPEWLKHRRAFQPHFQPSQLGRYLGTFSDEVKTELHSWPEQGTIDAHESMTRLTMRIILKTVFGADPDEFASFEKIMSAAMTFFEGVAGTQTPLPTWIPTPTNLRFLEARKELRERLGEVVKSARKIGRQETLLAQLLAEKESNLLTEQQLIDEAITMLVAGHETSALTLCYSLQLLATHPLAQTKLRNNLRETGLPSTVEDCQAPGFLRNTLTECLRLYPVAWALGREATEPVEVAGYALKQGTQIYIHQWQAHRHPVYFPQAEKFIPERWTKQFSKTLPKHLYAPFGAGPRICIGHHFALAEMSILLAHLVDAFAFTPHSNAPLRFRASVTARPRDPVMLQIRRH